MCREGCHDDGCVQHDPLEMEYNIVLLRVLLSMAERSASVSVYGKSVELNRLSDHTGECLDVAYPFHCRSLPSGRPSSWRWRWR